MLIEFKWDCMAIASGTILWGNVVEPKFLLIPLSRKKEKKNNTNYGEFEKYQDI